MVQVGDGVDLAQTIRELARSTTNLRTFLGDRRRRQSGSRTATLRPHGPRVQTARFSPEESERRLFPGAVVGTSREVRGHSNPHGLVPTSLPASRAWSAGASASYSLRPAAAPRAQGADTFTVLRIARHGRRGDERSRKTRHATWTKFRSRLAATGPAVFFLTDAKSAMLALAAADICDAKCRHFSSVYGSNSILAERTQLQPARGCRQRR